MPVHSQIYDYANEDHARNRNHLALTKPAVSSSVCPSLELAGIKYPGTFVTVLIIIAIVLRNIEKSCLFCIWSSVPSSLLSSPPLWMLFSTLSGVVGSHMLRWWTSLVSWRWTSRLSWWRPSVTSRCSIMIILAANRQNGSGVDEKA